MKRPHKYGAVATEIDGIKFPSKREANRWSELKLLLRAGDIQNLRRQPRFPMLIGDTLICTYVGDFIYERGGQIIVEDAKGVRTDVYKIKRKLLAALHDINVVEV